MTVKKPRSNANKTSTEIKPVGNGTIPFAAVVEKVSHDTSESMSSSDKTGIDAGNQKESVPGVMKQKRVWPD